MQNTYPRSSIIYQTVTLAAWVPLLLFIFCARSLAAADWQSWQDQSIAYPSPSGITWSLKQQERWSEDVNTFSHYHAEAKATVVANEWLKLAAGFRQQYVRSRGDWNDEQRPITSAILNRSWQSFDWQNRHRFELRFRDDRDTILNYRNRTMFSGPPWPIAGAPRPYIFDEFFVDSRHGELHQNRLSAGIKAKLSPNLKLDGYGMWLTAKRMREWSDVFVVGARIAYRF